MQAIRVLHMVSSLDISSGVMGVIMNYYRNIDRNRVQFDFLYFTKGGSTFEGEIERLGGKTYCLPRPSIKGLLRTYKAYNGFFQSHTGRYKIVHLHEVYLNTIIFPTARKNGIKHLIAHSHSTKFSDRRLSALRNRLLCLPIKRQANVYFACSEAAGAALYGKRAVSSDQVRIVHNAIDVTRFEYNPAIRVKVRHSLGIDDKFVVGNIARYAVQKNHRFLLKVFFEVRKLQPKSVLMLIGDGPLYKEVKRQAKDLNLLDSVLFLGTRPNVEDYLQAMDVFVLPSLFEGLAVVLIESQYSGLKSITSDRVSLEAKISDRLQYLSLNVSPKRWATVICENNPIDRRTGTEDTWGKFNIAKQAKYLENIYLMM